MSTENTRSFILTLGQYYRALSAFSGFTVLFTGSRPTNRQSTCTNARCKTINNKLYIIVQQMQHCGDCWCRSLRRNGNNEFYRTLPGTPPTSIVGGVNGCSRRRRSGQSAGADRKTDGARHPGCPPWQAPSTSRCTWCTFCRAPQYLMTSNGANWQKAHRSHTAAISALETCMIMRYIKFILCML